MVLVDELSGAGEPVVEEGLVWREPELEVGGVGLGCVTGEGVERFAGPGEGHVGGRAVELGGEGGFVSDVGGEGAAAAVPPPVLGGVGGDAEVEATGAGGGGELADDVAVGAHKGGVPGGHVRGVHGEAVAVLGDGNDVAGTGLLEEVEPGVWVEVLGFEHGDEVFVAEGGLGAVGGDLVFVGGVAGDVHVAGVPLVSECRNGVDAPVEEDAELGVLKPGGGTVLGE